MNLDSIKTMPVVGMGATIYHYSDRTACTVIEVSPNYNRIVLQEDKATRVDNNGMSDSQSYTYETNPNGEIHTATLRKDGLYYLTGKRNLIGLGVRHAFHDYSF